MARDPAGADRAGGAADAQVHPARGVSGVNGSRDRVGLDGMGAGEEEADADLEWAISFHLQDAETGSFVVDAEVA